LEALLLVSLVLFKELEYTEALVLLVAFPWLDPFVPLEELEALEELDLMEL